MGDECGIVNGTRVDTHLVCACPEDLLDIVQGAEPPAYGQRQEELVCRTLDQVDDDTAFFL